MRKSYTESRKLPTGSIVEHPRYGRGIVLGEWGAWISKEPDQRPVEVNGQGIFNIRFGHGVESINIAWLKLIKRRQARTLAVRMKLSLLVAALFLAGSAFASPDIRVLVQKARPAVVEIGVFDQTGQLVATGTGFFISPDGTLLTNYHVITGATSILARDYQKKTYHLKRIVAASPESDVAELQFDAANLPYLTLGSTSSLVEGEHILAIGNPEGLEGTVSEGIVSAFRDNRTIIQISTAISHGSSGSPILDCESGQVIGIATSILREGQSLNFAISSEAVQTAVAKAENAAPSSPPVAIATPTPKPGPVVTATPPQNTADDLTGSYAFRQWKDGNYENAVRGFDNLIQLENKEWQDWNSIGTPLSETLRTHQLFLARAYALRGDAQRHLKHYGNAIRDYTEAISLCPDGEFSYAGRSKVYSAIGNRSQAAQDMEKARELKRNK